MSRVECILELTPSRLRAVILDGKSNPSSTSIPYPAEWQRTWEKHLTPLYEPVTALLDSLPTRPSKLHVVYFSPGAAADVVSFPKSDKVDHSSLILAAQDVLHVEQNDQPLVTLPLVTDADSPDPQQHILAATDANEHTEAIIDLIRAVNCRVGNILPMHAYILRNTTPTVLPSGDTAPQVRITLAEHTTTLSVFDCHKLHFVRTIDIGLWQLVELYMRVLSDDKQSLEETRSAAWNLLFKTGIPEPHQVIDQDRNIEGKHFLPMIQPVLQRIFVEIKQSLRFGIPRDQLDRAQITLIGPGAAIPNLVEHLANHLDINVEAKPASCHDPENLDLENTISAFSSLGCARPAHTLTSFKRSRELTLKRSRQGMIVGASLVLLAILGNTALQILHVQQSQTRIASLKPQADSINEARFLLEQTNTLYDDLTVMNDTLGKYLNAKPAWSIFLHSLSAAVPETIRLTAMRGDMRGENPSLRIEGIEFSRRSSGAIQALLTSLQDNPMVDSVELGGTRRTMTERGIARQFNLTITLVPTDLQDWMHELP